MSRKYPRNWSKAKKFFKSSHLRDNFTFCFHLVASFKLFEIKEFEQAMERSQSESE
jgi:hypothetical protein